MTGRRIETGVHYWPMRHVPVGYAADFARRLEAAGVDWFGTFDQLVGFLPQAKWTPDVTEWANEVKDPHSYHDSKIVAGIAAAATENLNVTTTTDAVRSGPAELLQSMLTLAGANNGRASIQVGAGEMKQMKSFGYKRSEGLARMEDLLRVVRLLLETEGPISDDGNFVHYENTFIGAQRPGIPEFWALGGGPKLIDLATSYADGFVSVYP